MLPRFGQSRREPVAQPDVDAAMGLVLSTQQVGKEGGQGIDSRLNGYRSLAVLLPSLFHLVGDGVERLFPSDLNEFSRPALAHPLKRHLKTVDAVSMLNF